MAGPHTHRARCSAGVRPEPAGASGPEPFTKGLGMDHDQGTKSTERLCSLQGKRVAPSLFRDQRFGPASRETGLVSDCPGIATLMSCYDPMGDALWTGCRAERLRWLAAWATQGPSATGIPTFSLAPDILPQSKVRGSGTLSERGIERLTVAGLLSFGSRPLDLSLGSLNVLIGPNASGKSNLLETIGLLQSTPGDLQATLRDGGLPSDWLWKAGAGNQGPAVIEAVLPYSNRSLHYLLRLSGTATGFSIDEERLENNGPSPGHETSFRYFHVQNGHGAVTASLEDATKGTRRLRPENLNPTQSVLSQRRDPEIYPEITQMAQRLGSFQIYRDWRFGRTTPPRWQQKADLPGDFLASDASNLALVLNHGQKTGLLENVTRIMRDLYDQFQEVTTITENGGVQVYVREVGGLMPATRLSDGTLRMLCLATILCHPSPPPLLCIEEPEIGLHPDAIAIVAELLQSAGEHTQLIVTTHSEELVSHFTHRPEAVVVCEPSLDGTVMHRLDPKPLEDWLQAYRLGQVWRNGELGGNRW